LIQKFLIIILLLITSAYAKELNLNALLEDAKKQNKQILLFLHIPNCEYCTIMKKENLRDKETVDTIDKFFLFKQIGAKDRVVIDGKSISHKEFAKKYSLFAFPSSLFMNSNGRVLYRSMGFRNIDEYLTEIKYIGSKSYKNISMDEFRENLEFEKDD